MKKKVLLVLCVLLLTACAPGPPQAASTSEEAAAVQKSEGGPVPEEEPSEDLDSSVTTMFTPDSDLSPEETVEAYFEQQYLSYISFDDIDLSSIIDMEQKVNRTAKTWVQLLNQRRRLIWENELCYVETEMYPYSIWYVEEEELSDQRMQVWSDNDMLQDSEITLHLVLDGEKGRAYPPLMAMNSQHSFHLKKVDGSWRIINHYFTGAYRKYARYNYLITYTDEEMLQMLEEEFSPSGSGADASAGSYDAALAVDYAMLYTEAPNEDFYDIGDWMGNCANFVSQCVWYGFSGGGISDVSSGENMTSSWYGGGGGGTPAWENVVYFWEDITQPGGLSGTVLENAYGLRPGDIIQTKPLVGTPEDRFNHCLIVVDEDTLQLAQNSPNCFVYYADLVNVETRYVRPD